VLWDPVQARGCLFGVENAHPLRVVLFCVRRLWEFRRSVGQGVRASKADRSGLTGNELVLCVVDDGMWVVDTATTLRSRSDCWKGSAGFQSGVDCLPSWCCPIDILGVRRSVSLPSSSPIFLPAAMDQPSGSKMRTMWPFKKLRSEKGSKQSKW
jgi:hypothetical protein